MRLLSLHVENFGTLQNFDLSPAEGFNVLYQKNGWGKSTLAVFIKAMLYGLPATAKRSLDENERKKYTPWQGGAFGGSIEFETAKGRFRAERFFGAKESLDTFALFDLETNLPSTAYSVSLGEDLFGIDADGFERSTYLSQRILTGSRDNTGITAKLGDLLDDVDDIGSFDTAMDALDKRRKFYTLTGGRGSIAETEAEILKVQNELEHCRRVEETLRGRTEELSACTAALRSAETEARDLRTAMQKVGLAREQAAFSDQKNRMQSELSDLTRRRERINDFFRNAPPSPLEINEGKHLYESILEAKAQLDAIPTEIAEADALAALRRRYPKGAPDAKTVEKIAQDNDELITLHAKHAALREGNVSDPIIRRFPGGAPDAVEIEEAYKTLRQTERLKKEADAARGALGTNKPSGAIAALSAVFLCVGALLFAIAFLPALAAAFLPLCIGGALLALTGTVLLAVFHSKKRSYRQKQRQAEQKALECKNEINRLVGGICEMLSAYGLRPTSDEDLSRNLGELSSLSSRYHEAVENAERSEELLRTVTQSINGICARLHTLFASFWDGLPYKTDYRAELDRMLRELDRLSQLESAARTRAEERAAAERKLRDRQQLLLPFLRRFDPAGKMRAGECLNFVSEQYAEYHRLGREIEEKQAALTAFVTEKKLDTAVAPTDAGEYDRLIAEEKALQVRIADLSRRCTVLKNDADHLSDEVDRIPELVAKEEQLRLRLAEYKANAATISNTAKFLEEAKTALSTRYLGGMQESFAKFLSRLTKNAAPEAVIDATFDVRLRERGQTRSMESFSRGWRDAVEFCTRLSLTDALYKDGEKPFLLLDDPFVNLDDERLPAARELLESLAADYQILYFVCHKDRI